MGPMRRSALAALVVSALLAGFGGVKRLAGGLFVWRVDVRWYTVALLGPAALWILVIVLDVAMGDSWPS